MKKWVLIYFPNGQQSQYTTCKEMTDSIIKLVKDITFDGPVVTVYEDVDESVEINRYNLPYWGHQW